MPDARRLAVAFVALVGLVLTVLGAWFAILLGPSGTATFTATATEPLVIGPTTLNRVAVPVTVSATSPRGPVFIATAVPQDATDAVGVARHQEVVVAEFPARTLNLATKGTTVLADPTGYDVWRATAQNTLVVSQANAPESVVVYPTTPGPVDVTLTWKRGAWFLEALAVLVIGLIILALAGGWLRQQLSRTASVEGHGTEEQLLDEDVPDDPDVPDTEAADPTPTQPVQAQPEAADPAPALPIEAQEPVDPDPARTDREARS